MLSRLEQQFTIIVEGRLSSRWADWFGEMEIELLPGGFTHFTGTLPDQAALYGILSRIADLELPLVLVCRGDFPLAQKGFGWK